MFEGVLICLGVFEREIRERREREFAQKLPRIFLFSFWAQNEGLGVIYTGKMTL